MNDFYDALEAGLQALEEGEQLEAVLQRQPTLSDELRPILEASNQARDMSAAAPSAEAVRRSRARVLGRAAELRAARRRSRRPIWPTFLRLAAALMLTAALLFSGTGLVSASSGALPGEKLYPVKRSWEDVQLLLVFDRQSREVLESEQEQERLDEVLEIIQKGRVVSITFSGVVTGQQANELIVSGVIVDLSDQTVFSGDAPTIGSAVLVTADTQTDGIVLAESVQTLPPGSLVPSGESAELEQDDTNAAASPEAGLAGQDSSSPGADAPSGPPEQQEPRSSFQFEGTVDSIQGDTWTINGRVVEVHGVQNQGSLSVGSNVEVEGFFTSDGRFIVTRIELNHSGSGRDGSGGGNGDGDHSGSGDGSGGEDGDDNGGGDGGGDD